MLWFRFFAASLFSILSVSSQADEIQYGSIEGRVVYNGEYPELEPLVRTGGQIKDAEVCAAADIPDETLVVDRESKGVSNVFVWLNRKNDARVHPDLTKEPLNLPELNFQGCRIQPHALCAQTQTGMKVVSKDGLPHNPHDYPVRNSSGCVGLSPWSLGDKESANFHRFRSAEPHPMKITCDYHPWMIGYVLVQDHPYMTVTDSQGRFRIDKIPHGEVKIQIWHELAGFLERNRSVELNVAEEKIEDAELKIDENTAAALRKVAR